MPKRAACVVFPLVLVVFSSVPRPNALMCLDVRISSLHKAEHVQGQCSIMYCRV